jgi:hypothetical protein
MIDIKRICGSDDLAAMAAAFKGAEWGVDNDQVDLLEAALREIVADSV